MVICMAALAECYIKCPECEGGISFRIGILTWAEKQFCQRESFFTESFKNRITSHFSGMVLMWSYLKGGEWTKWPLKIFLNPLMLGFYELCSLDNLGQLYLHTYVSRTVLHLRTSLTGKQISSWLPLPSFTAQTQPCVCSWYIHSHYFLKDIPIKSPLCCFIHYFRWHCLIHVLFFHSFSQWGINYANRVNIGSLSLSCPNKSP